MQPETNKPEEYLAPLKKVTPVSKYLAMTLFIILPFLGGWIGYNLAPKKVVEVEKFEFIQEINSNIPANNVQETQTEAFADGIIGIVASTSRYVLKSNECNSRDSQVTAAITCFSLEKSDGSLIHKNLADVAVSQGFFSESSSTSLYSFEYFSQAGDKIYFRTGVPDSSACCGLIEYNIPSNAFVDKRNVWFSAKSSFALSDSGRFLVTSDDSGKKISVLDIEKNERIFEDVLSEGSFDVSRCYQGALDNQIDIDVNFSDDETEFFYKVFNPKLQEGQECDYKLIEEKKVQLSIR